MCEHGNQIVVEAPSNIELKYNSPTHNKKTNVSIDECIVSEIKSLWKKGIRTTGCCCGHNGIFPTHVSVISEDITKMMELGYTRQSHEGYFFNLKDASTEYRKG